MTLNLQFLEMLAKAPKWYKTEALNIDAEYHSKKPIVCRHFRCFTRKQNDMAEISCNLILLSNNAIIRVHFICTSRLHLM